MKEDNKVKIIQFGEGNFLRAFVDWMIQVTNEKNDYNNEVYLIQPRDNDNVYRLGEQDFKYHVNLRGYENKKTVDKIVQIECIVDGLNTHKEYNKFLSLGEDPEIRLITSNTTEAGIKFDEEDDRFDISPRTFPGKLTALLNARYKKLGNTEESKLLVLPCELVEKNGEKLKDVVKDYCDLWQLGDGFKSWLDSNVKFVNTLVDRIVPGYPKDNLEIIRDTVGKDEYFVVAEPFHLWVIEDEEIEDILGLKKAGLNIVYTEDLTPYRDMKIRVLNGAHTSMVPIGILSSIETVSETISDKIVGSYIKDLIYEEIVPVVDLEEDTVRKYADKVLERFNNQYIRHELSDISLNSVSKFKVRVLPTILDYYNKHNELPKRLVESLSSLIVFYSGKYKKLNISLRDDTNIIDYFNKMWTEYYKNNIGLDELTENVLSNLDLWDTNLTQIDGLAKRVASNIDIILNKDIKTLLKKG